MNNFLKHILILFMPLIPTLVLHMLIVKKNLFSRWAVPIAKDSLGTNKTWRGLIFVSILNGLFSLIPAIILKMNFLHSFILGFSIGLAYMIAELPNSYIKRRMHIPPGGRHPKHPWLFLFVDKADSVSGVLLVYYLLSDVSLKTCGFIFLIGITTHLIISIILYKLKLKSAV